MNSTKRVFLLLSLSIALGATLAIVALELNAQQPKTQQAIEWLDNPRSLASFSLESAAGEFTNQSLMGHWTIVLFGFLHCPDICPTSLAQLSRLSAALTENSGKHDVTFVFVSVDPGRDSVAELSQYLQYFDTSILGVTGNEVQLTRFANSLGVRFEVSANKEDYSVAHSIKFSIIDPAGLFRGRFSPEFDTSGLARDLIANLE
ncbi:SCO family protein [Photobacterium halotolerans]|uniref:SCO family protein n=1 Tax=Photobacterium halotolerans TaxID=265726 RepID=UPI0003FCFDF8|nr:SCO family protein [Photobacterium halotolerans]